MPASHITPEKKTSPVSVIARRSRTVGLDGDYTVVTGYLEQNDLPSGPPAGAPVESSVFKSAMRVLVGAVVIVTTRLETRPWGLTISSCGSLTLEPPQILVSLRSTSVSCQEILKSERFGVSILASDQKALAERGAAVGTAKFMDEDAINGDNEPLGSPMIKNALFHLDCSVNQHHRVGDHELIIGFVHHGKAAREGAQTDPLLYFDREFWSIGDRL